MKLDPSSTRVILRYTGSDAGEPHIGGIPARDLTEHDVAHLLTRVGRTDADAFIAELLSGPYRKPAPAASGKPED